MSEFEEKLNSVLSNPEAMSQIMNLAQSLNLGGSGGGQQSDGQGPAAPQAQPEAAAGAGGGPDLSGLSSLLGQIDPKLIGRLLPLVGELTGGEGSDERMQLLYALRPFLRPERRDKIERAARTAKLIHVGKKLLSAMGDSDV